MGRRNDIDWQRVERLYIANQLTIRQIADECGVNPSSIKVHAKTGGWKRDITEAIQARTKAKVAAIDVEALIEQSATENAYKSAQTIKRAIEQASDVAAGVILRHRKSFREQTERAAAIETLFDAILLTAGAEDFDVQKAASAFKAMVDARAKLVGMERESFGIAGLTQKDERNVDDLPPGDAWRVCSNALS